MYKQFGTGEFVEVANDCIDIFCQRFKELEGYYKNNSEYKTKYTMQMASGKTVYCSGIDQRVPYVYAKELIKLHRDIAYTYVQENKKKLKISDVFAIVVAFNTYNNSVWHFCGNGFTALTKDEFDKRTDSNRPNEEVGYEVVYVR